MKGMIGSSGKKTVLMLMVSAAGGVFAEQIVFQHKNKPDALYEQAATSVSSQYKDSTGRAEGDLLVGNNSPGSVYRALLGFDLSAIPAGSQIKRVSLRLMQASDPHTEAGAAVSIDLCVLNDTVSESFSTWKNSEGKYGAVLQTVEVKLLAPNGYKQIDFSSQALTDAVAAAVTSGARIGLAVKAADENFAGRQLIMFRGNEYEKAVSRPQLVVDYIPGVIVGDAGAVAVRAVLASR